MDPEPTPRRIFSLREGLDLLLSVKRVTADAVRRAEALAAELRDLDQADPEHVRVAAELEDVVNDWATRLHGMSLAVKGLWLVDFDNGEGYYCWCHPEETVAHYHSYEGGFAGRMKIM